MHSLETWPAHAPDGLSQPQPCPAQEHKPHHPDTHAVPWHQYDTDPKDPEPSVSSKNVTEMNPQNTMSYQVCRSFSDQDSFNASTKPTNPVTSNITVKARHKYRSPVVYPYNTNLLTPSVTRPAARPPAGRRQVGTLPAN